MLCGIYNHQASSGAVGYLSSPGGTALYTGTDPWNREGGKTWLMPPDAQKPLNPRTRKTATDK